MNLKKKLAKVFAMRWLKAAWAGKKGEGMQKLLKSLHGIRSAIMALVLVAEVVARSAGWDTGPAFGIIRGLFDFVGWDINSAAATIGIDPVAVGAGIVTVYVAVQRFIAWAKTKTV